MSEASPKNSWQPSGKATLVGLGLLVVFTLVRLLLSSAGDIEERRAERTEFERVQEDLRRLDDEGHTLSKQLEELSAAVGWRPASEDDEAGQPPDSMLTRVLDGARISFTEQDSPAWRELDALTDEELIAEVRSLRDRVKGLEQASEREPLSGLRQRLEVARSILDNRGLEH